MELHRLRHHHSHRTDDKLQMLNLNQRLETYLGRVRLLEEENKLLCQEIQALRGSGQGGRMGLEDKLSLARQEVEEAWREKDRVELELGSLGEELQVLGLQRQWVADAHGEVKKKLADSRKQMEEERRAQIWLREKVSQLEKQIQFQIQTHQEDVAGFQATLIHVRPALPPPPPQTGTQLPSLQELGEEYSQMAVRAWHEAAMVFQGQVDSLDESLNQARTRLAQVGQEKIESQLKLQALENELQSAQDKRQYLERSVAKQRDRQRQEIQNLQAHLDVLEMEKGALGNQIDTLLTESRGLLQLKMSLGMEVATYRALLDNENLKGDFSSTNQLRSTYISDGVPSSRGAKQSFQSQQATSHMIRPISTIHRASPRSNVTMMSASPIWTQNRVTLNETPKSCRKTEEEHIDFGVGSNHQVSCSPPYPEVPQDGISVDHFRPQDVHKEVNHAEPLSPPTAGADVVSWLGSDHKEQSMWDMEKEEEDQNTVRTWFAEEKPVLESAMSHQVETSFSMPTVFSTDAQELLSPSVSYERAGLVTGAHYAFSANDDNDLPFEMSFEKEEPLLDMPYGPMNASEERDLETASKDAEWAGNEGLESETASVLKQAFETFTSSQAFEYGAGKSYNKPIEFNQEDNMSYESSQASHGLEEAFRHVKRVEEDVINLPKEDENDMSNKHEEQLEDELHPYGYDKDNCERLGGFNKENDMTERIDEFNHENIINLTKEDDENDMSNKDEDQLEHELRPYGYGKDNWEILGGFNKENDMTERIDKFNQEEIISYESDQASHWSEEVFHHVERVVEGDIHFRKGDDENDMSNKREEQNALNPNGDVKDEWDRVEGYNEENGIGERMDDWKEGKYHMKEEEMWNNRETQPNRSDQEDIPSNVEKLNQFEQEHIPSGGEKLNQSEQRYINSNGEKLNQSEQEHIPSGGEKLNISDNDKEDHEANLCQNNSVSWRAELEGDSYAQDNTLADTHPLIRYKSDETDVNTQASHMGESDSSDGEEDREVCQTGTDTWGEGKSKQFDTMEYLYEESEVDVIDQESNMGSTHQEDMDASQTKEHAKQENDEENAGDQLIQKAEEEQSYEELTEPGEYSMVCSDEDYNEETIDRLVEQELENLSISSYSEHFTGQMIESESVLSLQIESHTELSQTQDILYSEEVEQIHSERLNQSEQEYIPSGGEKLNLYEQEHIPSDREKLNQSESEYTTSGGEKLNLYVQEHTPSDGEKLNQSEQKYIPSGGEKVNQSEPEYIISGGEKLNQSEAEYITSGGEKLNLYAQEYLPSDGEKMNPSVPEHIPSNGEKLNQSEQENIPSGGEKLNQSEAENIPSNGEKPNQSQQENIPLGGEKLNQSEQENLPSGGEKLNQSEQENIHLGGEKLNQSEQENLPSGGEKLNQSEQENLPLGGEKLNQSEPEYITSGGEKLNLYAQEHTPSDREKMNQSEQENIPSGGEKLNQSEADYITSGGETLNVKAQHIPSDGEKLNQSEQENIHLGGEKLNQSEPEYITSGGEKLNQSEQENIPSGGEKLNQSEQENIPSGGEKLNQSEQENIPSGGEKLNQSEPEYITSGGEKLNQSEQENIPSNREKMNPSEPEYTTSGGETLDICEQEHIPSDGEKINQPDSEHIPSNGEKLNVYVQEHIPSDGENLNQSEQENIPSGGEKLNQSEAENIISGGEKLNVHAQEYLPSDGEKMNPSEPEHIPSNGEKLNQSEQENLPSGGETLDICEQEHIPSDGEKMYKSEPEHILSNGEKLNQSEQENIPLGGKKLNQSEQENIPLGGKKLNQSEQENIPLGGKKLNQSEQENIPLGGKKLNQSEQENLPSAGENLNQSEQENLPSGGEKLNQSEAEDITSGGETLNVNAQEHIPSDREKLNQSEPEYIPSGREKLNLYEQEHIPSDREKMNPSEPEYTTSGGEKLNQSEQENIPLGREKLNQSEPEYIPSGGEKLNLYEQEHTPSDREKLNQSEQEYVISGGEKLNQSETEDITSGGEKLNQSEEQYIPSGGEKLNQFEQECLPSGGEKLNLSEQQNIPLGSEKLNQSEPEYITSGEYKLSLYEQEHIPSDREKMNQSDPEYIPSGGEKLNQSEQECISSEVRYSVHSRILMTSEHTSLRESSVEISKEESLAQDKEFSGGLGTEAVPDKIEGQDHQNLYMLTHADFTESHSIYSSLNSRPESQTNMNNLDIEESNSTDDESPNASQYLQPVTKANLTADQEDLLDVAVSHYENCNTLIEHSAEEVTSYQASNECLQTDEWEVLESPNKHLASRDPFAGHKRDSERSSKTDSEGQDLHSFLSSGVHNNFWGSNLETGASYQPDEPYDHVTELPNQNLALADNLSWVDLENPQAANWNTKMDSDTPKASTLGEEDKQMPSQVKQLVCRDVVEGVNVTSEDEGDSWSYGEE
ncbi:nestin isoform X1 [Salmo salar]|uniref:Nestin isoform X1 n=1 Tax=Salmo salar TaxID=8030 RepID=A0A1S3RWK5_SALSA|nr:nestin-like isoform X1 [Salmo salar]